MRSIRLYDINGVLKEEVGFTEHNLLETGGMMVRCHMRDGSIQEGFSSPFCNPNAAETKLDYDHLYLWTWKHLNEETHRLEGDEATKYDTTVVAVKISEIESIEAILYSGPRWGGRLHNQFFVEVKDCSDVGESIGLEGER